MSASPVFMGDQGVAAWGTATNSDSTGQTLLDNTKYDIIHWTYRSIRKSYPASKMSPANANMERVVVSGRKQLRGQVTVMLKSSSGETPKQPADGYATLTLSNKASTNSIAFSAYLTAVEASANSISGEPQTAVFDFISSGESDVTQTG